MQMKKRAVAYVTLISLLGLIGIAFCGRQIWLEGQLAHPSVLISMLILCTLCRSFPIYMRSDQAIDVSILSIVAICLYMSPAAAVVMYVVSSFFSVDRSGGDGKVYTIYNTPLYKTIFNLANVTLAVLVPAALCKGLGILLGDMRFPQVILPTMIYAVGAFGVNALIMMLLFYLNGQISLREALSQIIGLTPNVLAAMPISLLLAMLYGIPSGEWIVLLMLLPLMLARYAWKLYLDSKGQQMRMIQVLVSTMEAKDPYTQGHSRRVCEYAVQIARAKHLRESQVEQIREGAVLHDLGKIGVDDRILRKPAALTPDERVEMERHPEIGVAIIKDLQLKPDVVEMIHDHHRRYDGGGYPEREGAEKPGLYARILGVADAYDAMTSDRPYRKGMPQEVAIRILRENAGTQFDPEIVDVFTGLLEENAKAAP